MSSDTWEKRSIMSFFLLRIVAVALLSRLAIGQNVCPSLYRRYSVNHTFCLPPNGQCQILVRGVSPQDARMIVRLHNEKRNKIAMGKESIGNLPPAGDMIEMEWDDELAAVAQKHAEQCKFEHDCNECRQIQNFPAGQNLYESWFIGNFNPKPQWKDAIESWYDEVNNFNKKIVGSFSTEGLSGVIGHFTQVIWSESWKVGCGYVIHRKGAEFKQLYTCNYGPAGNGLAKPVYTSGKPCSRCPTNSCCGKSCNGLSSFDGLCKILDSKSPKTIREETYDFLCDFESPQMCNFFTPFGMKRWEVTHTLAGSHIGIILNGGETSALNFTTPFKAWNPSCLSVKFRKGPNVAGQPGVGIAQEHFKQHGFSFDVPLSPNTAEFMTYGMNLNYQSDFTFSVTFSVPAGNPAQYFEMTDIYLRKGKCSS